MSLIFEALQRVEHERTGIDWPPPPETDEMPRYAEHRQASKGESASNRPIGESRHSDRTEPSRSANPPMAGAPIANLHWAGPAEASPLELPTGMRRAVAVLRVALPALQGILSLFEEDTAAPPFDPQPAPPAPPLPPPVEISHSEIAPIEASLAGLKTQQSELSSHIVEQNASFKRIEDRLGMVREATDRNTLEQQELIGELHGIGKKMTSVAMAALVLAATSVILEVVFYLRIAKILP